MGIQSQSTDGMNNRLMNLFSEVDVQAVSCANNPNLPSIHHYFSLLEQIYVNISSLFDEDLLKLINEQKKAYYETYVSVLKDASQATPMNMLKLLSATRKINNIIIHGLQQQNYFFILDKKTSQKAYAESVDINDYLK